MLWNGLSLLRSKEDLVIETDASKLELGASCNELRQETIIVS